MPDTSHTHDESYRRTVTARRMSEAFWDRQFPAIPARWIERTLERYRAEAAQRIGQGQRTLGGTE